MALDKVDQIEKSLSPEGLAAAEEWLSSLSDQERDSILRQLAG